MKPVSIPENKIQQKNGELKHDNFLPENFCSGTVTENKIIILSNNDQTSVGH